MTIVAELHDVRACSFRALTAYLGLVSSATMKRLAYRLMAVLEVFAEERWDGSDSACAAGGNALPSTI